MRAREAAAARARHAAAAEAATHAARWGLASIPESKNCRRTAADAADDKHDMLTRVPRESTSCTCEGQ